MSPRFAAAFLTGCATAYGVDRATGGWRGLSWGAAWLLTVLIITATTILLGGPTRRRP